MLASATDVATRWFPGRVIPRRAELRSRAGSNALTQLRQGLAARLHRLADQQLATSPDPAPHQRHVEAPQIGLELANNVVALGPA